MGVTEINAVMLLDYVRREYIYQVFLLYYEHVARYVCDTFLSIVMYK